ncbi:MAG TPA: hypothetical protein VNL14_08245 [Candidatus Acidoferrales bacterium]|nr:hypothetical protein [Candidatus Acidoferrales bacterium]
MRRDFYKGYAINASAVTDDADSQGYIPKAEIFWHDGAERKCQALIETARRFRTPREAEIFAIQMSKIWIREMFDSTEHKPN